MHSDNMSSVKWRRRSQSFGTYGSFKQRLEEPYKEDSIIEGYAYLCFPKDGSWFRGSLVGADCTAYSLFGRCVKMTRTEEEPITLAKSLGKQRSMDSQMERELQFALDDFPLSRCEGPCSPEVTPPESPPAPEQLLTALDNLHLQDSGHFSSEEKEDSTLSSAASTPSFRSRSGSKSMEHFVAKYDVKITDLEEGSDVEVLNVVGRHGTTCALRSRQFCFVTEKAYWGQRADMMIHNNMGASDLVGQGCHVFAGPAKVSYTRVFPSPSPSDKTYW